MFTQAANRSALPVRRLPSLSKTPPALVRCHPQGRVDVACQQHRWPGAHRFAGDQLEHALAARVEARGERLQRLRASALSVADETKKQVLGTDLGTPALTCPLDATNRAGPFLSAP
jgi:hypothetical protein